MRPPVPGWTGRVALDEACAKNQAKELAAGPRDRGNDVRLIRLFRESQGIPTSGDDMGIGPCEICQKQRNLELHHMDGYPYISFDRAQFLCKSCHAKQPTSFIMPKTKTKKQISNDVLCARIHQAHLADPTTTMKSLIETHLPAGTNYGTLSAAYYDRYPRKEMSKTGTKKRAVTTVHILNLTPAEAVGVYRMVRDHGFTITA